MATCSTSNFVLTTRVGPRRSVPTAGTASGKSPIAPSASFDAQKRRNAMAFNATVMLWGLFVKAIKQLTQSVKVVVSVSAMHQGTKVELLSGSGQPTAHGAIISKQHRDYA
eukprot:GHUV01045240.1.p1 GENE.GHUV01045240.1~~GHUV01045240.1.p1  ORF type:complete len:111 (+),score=15.50 GHUV01045240.1:552-884(+)